MQHIVCIIALFCCLSSGFSKASRKRFFLDNINSGDVEKFVDEDCIRCICSGHCHYGDITKGICQTFTNMMDCSNDQCGEDTCSGHGHCYAVHKAGRICTCIDGYTGKHCDQKPLAVTTPVDNCAKTPCQNGQCSSTDSGYVCTCDVGWKGTNCDTSTTPLFTPAPALCANNPCGAHGQCTSDASGYQCACVTGWSGKNCEIVTSFPEKVTCDAPCTDMDNCAKSPCINGQCSSTDNGYSCTCNAGWQGTNCDTSTTPLFTPAPDLCSNNPCGAHGQCTSDAGGYQCTCVTGWRGQNCEIDIDQCNSSPCKNNGTCLDLGVFVSCICADGWSGPTCEIVDNCANSPCINGQCSSTASGYLCTCNVGWQGTNCDTSTTPLFTPAPDLCANNPCGGHGQCTSDAGGYQCTCVTGWRGQNCEIDIDQCNSSPCKNNGTCLDLGVFVSCICADGWSGPTCEIDATPSCKHLCVLEPVATVHSVFNDSALKCNDANRGSNEAIPMTCCGLGLEDTWLKGTQVIAHCSGAEALPTYTPIASFKSGRPADDTSGVFVGCDANGFKYIRQTCGATPHVIIVDGSNGMDPSSFYVIY